MAIECVIQDLLTSLCARHCGELWDAKWTGTDPLTAQIPSKSLPPLPLFSMHFKQSSYFIHEDGEAKIWEGRETESLVAYFIKCRLARHEKAVSPRSSCFSTQCDTDLVVCSRSPLGKKLQIHNSLSLSSSKESLCRGIKLVEDYLGYLS